MRPQRAVPRTFKRVCLFTRCVRHLALRLHPRKRVNPSIQLVESANTCSPRFREPESREKTARCCAEEVRANRIPRESVSPISRGDNVRDIRNVRTRGGTRGNPGGRQFPLILPSPLHSSQRVDYRPQGGKNLDKGSPTPSVAKCLRVIDEFLATNLS